MHDLPAQTATRDEPRRWYRWELLGLLCGTFFLHQADRAIFGVVLPAIKVDLLLTDAQLGLVGTVLFATLAVLMPVTGYLGDIWSRKWIITVSLLFWSFATMVTGMARGMAGLVAFRSVATGGGEAFYAPAAYSLLAQFHRKTRALAMSVHQCAVYLGVIASGYLGGYIAEQWGWRSAFYIFGSGGILFGIVLCFRLMDSPRDPATHDDPTGTRAGPVEALGILFCTPTAMLITLAFTGYVFVNNAYLVWAPTFVGEKFQLSLGEAGGCSMLYYFLAATIGVLIGGRVSDALVASRRGFRLEFQCAALFLGIPAILCMGLAGTLTGALVAMVAAGVSNGLYSSNIHAALFDVIAPRYRASAVAMMTTVGFLAGSISPWLLGCCREVFPSTQGLSYGFAALSTAYLVGGLAVLIAAKLTFPGDYCEESPLPVALPSEGSRP